FFQAEDGIRDLIVTGVQTCALPISSPPFREPDCRLEDSSHLRTALQTASAELAPGCEFAPHAHQGITGAVAVSRPLRRSRRPWMMENTVGTKNSVAKVAKIRPPITARPRGAFCSPPSPRPMA